MSMERRKLYYAIGCILPVALLCFVGGIRVLKWYQQMTDCHDGNLPLRSFEVTIDISQQPQLISLNKFAEENDFRFHIIKYTPNGEDFLLQLTRKDLEVSATNPFALGRFSKVGFYNNDCTHPTVVSDIDGLVNDLKSYINEIPNVTITEEK